MSQVETRVRESPPLEWWLRKASYIVRKRYDEIRVQAVQVDLGDLKFYDVYIHHPLGEELYMDSLDVEDVGKLLRALNIICKLVDWAKFSDGFMYTFKECTGGD